MHARQQAEFASWLAANARTIGQNLKSLQGLEVERYWVSSKLRLERWQSALKLFEADLTLRPPVHNPWPALETVVEEILLSDILTRVWSAILLSIDRQRQRDDFSGLVYSVFLQHLESKNRALRLILAGAKKQVASIDRLNTIRRFAEKWTDLLLSQLPDQEVACRFAADRQRLQDFAREQRGESPEEAARRAAILRESFRSALRSHGKRWGANPQLNRQIVEGVLLALDHQLAEATAIPQSYIQLWLEKSHYETTALIDALDRMDRLTNRRDRRFAANQ